MEYTMKAKQFFALTALTLAAGAVLADDAPSAPLTRAEVVQSVLAARANGTLRHSGEIAPEEQMEDARAHPSASTLTRADEKADVLAARAAGTLRHSGEIAPEEQMEYAQAHPATSTLTRAEVKAEVLEARANGTLIPAGEGGYPIGEEGNPESRAYAANRVASPSATLHASK
jgi:hypothetical protein